MPFLSVRVAKVGLPSRGGQFGARFKGIVGSIGIPPCLMLIPSIRELSATAKALCPKKRMLGRVSLAKDLQPAKLLL